MSQATSGPCIVCGEETLSRCEACRQAGIDLFFCSREHQKLLWSVHKKVCGPGKANPFTWPPLSQDEADEAKKHLHTKVASLDGNSLSTILSRDGGVDGQDQVHLIQSLVDPAPQSHSSRLQQLYLVSVRSSEHERLCRSSHGLSKTPVQVLRAASFFVVGCLSDQLLRAAADCDRSPAWHSYSCHFLLAWFGLGIHLSGTGADFTFPEPVVHFSDAMNRFQSYFDKTVRGTDPQAADAVLAYIARGVS